MYLHKMYLCFQSRVFKSDQSDFKQGKNPVAWGPKRRAPLFLIVQRSAQRGVKLLCGCEKLWLSLLFLVSLIKETQQGDTMW